MKAFIKASIRVHVCNLILTAILGGVFGSGRCLAAPPTVTTVTATSPTLNGITLNGTVNPNGADATAWFQYGLTSAYGSNTPVIFVSATNVTAVAVSNLLTGLSQTTTYHYRLVATNSQGTNNGFDFTFSTATYSNVNLALPGFYNASAAWGDYDNDGKLDFLIAGSGTNGGALTTQVWHNQGNGIFTNLNAGLPGIQGGSVAWGDYDNDGRLDILIAGGSICQVWHNQGNGTFANINAGLPPLYSCSVAWGDFDNDGRPDILLTGSTNASPTAGITQIWRNLGNGTFSNLNLTLPGTYLSGLAVADFDNDGNLDFILSGNTNGPLTAGVSQLWRNLGNGTFTNLDAALPGFTESTVAWGDYDNDGKIDLVLSGIQTNATSTTQIWHNQGNGVFTNLTGSFLAGLRDGMASWGDYDNDGRPDLLISSLGNQPSALYHNVGNGSFTNMSPGFPAVYSGTAPFGDFDNDGKLDVLAAGTTNNTTSGALAQLFRNYTPVANTIPATPSSLTAVSNSLGGVILSWKAGSDSQTPAAGLSYNIRIGSTPGGSDILSPGADATTGFRRVPRIGNAGQRLFANLTNLPYATTYYWSVQAIDGAYAGSAFATEGSFSFPSAAPKITNAQALNLVSTSATPSAQVNPGGLATTVSLAYGATTSYGTTNIFNLGSSNNFVSIFQNLTGLVPNQTYHFLVIASNSLGTATSGDVAYTTPPTAAPSATTLPASLISLTTATVNGTANPNGVATTVYFLYGPTTAYGFTNVFGSIGSANSLVSVTKALSGLLPGQVYHFQVMAGSSLGTNYGADLTFTNTTSFPFVSTLPVTNPNMNGATINGTITPNGSDTTAWFQYGLTTSYGTNTPSVIVSATNGVAVAVSNLLSGLPQTTFFHYRLVGSNSFGTILGGDVVFSTTSFTNMHLSLPGVVNATVAWGDYDNDGKLDILLTGAGTNGVPISQVWHNQGNGTFTNLNAGLPGVATGSAAWGDYDNDGRLDILIAGSGLCQVWHNQSNGTFTNLNAGLPALFNGCAAWGDFNNDGKLDIILTGSTNNSPTGVTAQIRLNQGNGTFTNLNAGLPGLYFSSVAVADFDSDGYLDFVLSGTTNGGFNGGISQLWRNLGNGTFTNMNSGLPGLTEAVVSWGDYDNDGKLDLSLTGIGTNSIATAQIWHHQGNGVFTNLNLTLSGGRQGGAPWGDYDNDGKPDFISTGLGNIPSALYRNAGNGSFTNILPGLPSVYFGAAAFADFDNDGRLDILTTGSTNGPSSGGSAQLFKNNTPVANTAPAAPSGLVATTNGSGVLLTWSAGSDAETPVAGLSYNLRVGSFPGGSDVVSPQADSATGFRRVPQLGNVQQGLSATLTNLPLGNYYWSVQTIDSAYAGSAFATEGTFSFPGAPVIATLPASGITGSNALFNALVQPGGMATVAFEYGSTTNYGSTVLVTNLPVGNSVVASSLVAVLPVATYHYRAVATNGFGFALGAVQSFTTPTTVPLIATLPASSITENSAFLNGSIDPGGLATTVYFQYGLTAAYGAYTDPAPVGIGSTNIFVMFGRALFDLNPGTTYHYRVVGSNSLGIVYGADQILVTQPNSAPILSDFVNVLTPVNTPTAAIPFTVSDAETPAGNLAVTATSGNTSLVPQSNLVLAGAGATRSLTITPAAGQRGSTAIIVSVSDGLAVTSKSFMLNVGVVSGDVNGDGIVDLNELNGVLTNYWLNSQGLYMTNPVKLSDGRFQFGLTNQNAWNFSVLASTNMVNWEVLTNPATPVYQFIDPQAATNAPQRYYWLRYP